jgi:hypothetical protein
MGFARHFRPTYAEGERGAPVQGTRLAVGRPKSLASSKHYPAQASLDKTSICVTHYTSFP